MNHMEIVIPAKSGEIKNVWDEIDKILTKEDFSEEEVLNSRLALEEVIINIIIHGYHGEDGIIEILCDSIYSGISIEISDYAPAFNPLSIEKPDLKSGTEERTIGGLGIYLVKKAMDEVKYRHENNKNILTLVKYRQPHEKSRLNTRG